MSDTIFIYIYGCSTCGINSILIRKVKKYALENNRDFVVKNTKYSKSDRDVHADYLSSLNLDTANYHAIVVDGDNITLLKLWKPY